MQAVLPNGHVDIAQDVTLICPKADHTGTPDPYLAPSTTPQPFTPHTAAPHTNSGHTLAGSGHTLLSTLYPEHSFIHSTPAPPSLGPGPDGPTVPYPQWGTLGPLELTKLDSVGMWEPSACTCLCLGPLGSKQSFSHCSVTNPRYPSVPGAVSGSLWAHPLHGKK